MSDELFKAKIPTLQYLCGSRGSGKTFLLIQLFMTEGLYFQEFDKIYVFSPSLMDENDASLFDYLNLPSKQLFYEFDEKKLDMILKKKKRKPQEQWAIIFDDVIGDKEFKNNDLVKTICLNGRHMGVSMFITSQKSTLGTTSVRTNADGCFFFRPRSGNELEAIYKDSCINGINRKQFTKLVMDATVEKHDFLYINYQNNTTWHNFKQIETPTYQE